MPGTGLRVTVRAHAMKRFLREPLVHFVALGLGLFWLYALVADSTDAPSDRIEISAAQVEQLAELFARTWQRSPTERELAGLIEDHIREEIYYREALAMGLDEGDTVVRRRMRQKLEFVADELVSALEPTEEELERYLRENPDLFREPARLSFRQVYLSADRRGAAIQREATALLERLQDLPADVDLAALGDPLMLANVYDRVRRDDVARDFGGDFAAALDELPVGRWSGPVASGFGVHLVRLGERWPGRVPPLAEIRERVARDWRRARREEAEEAFYASLRERYVVRVQMPGAPGAAADPATAEVRP